MATLNQRHPNNNADAAGDDDNHNNNAVVLIDQDDDDYEYNDDDDDENIDRNNKALRSSSSSYYSKRLYLCFSSLLQHSRRSSFLMKIGFFICCCSILILLSATMNSNSDRIIMIVKSSSYNNKDGLRRYPSPPQNNNNLYNKYEPSILESYIVNNGRSKKNMRYDRQIISTNTNTNDDDDDSNYNKARPSSFLPYLIPSFMKDDDDDDDDDAVVVLRKGMIPFIRKNYNYNNLDYQKLSSNLPSGCELWKNSKVTTPKIYDKLQTYRKHLQDYNYYIKQFQWNYNNHNDNNGDKNNKINNENKQQQQQEQQQQQQIKLNEQKQEQKQYYDLRDYFTDDDVDHHNPNNYNRKYNKNDAICDSLKLDGRYTMSHIFLPSFLSKSSDGIYMEPLLPPLRSPEMCYGSSDSKNSTSLDYHHLLDLDYLIHDFVNICKKRIHKYSRTIFIDMGASLQYHIDDKLQKSEPPTLQLLNLYSKFGIQFDHIYGYEYTIMDPNLVYNVQIPNKYKAAYHWYNIGVSSNITSYTNPLRLILDTYNKETDFIVIKLDIDTPTIEIQLSKLLLEIPELTKLVDIFYFEHHIAMKELSAAWKSTMINSGSIQDSMELFTSLREHNILAHYWI